MHDRTPALGRLLRYASRKTSFYAKRLAGVGMNRAQSPKEVLGQLPLTRLADLVEERIRTSDAHSSRMAWGRRSLVTFQLDYAEETPLYAALDRADLQAYAGVLKQCLTLLGVRPGDTIGIFDYGTSPVAYLASSCYTPYLREGAADALGCTAICNDGVTQMSQRAVDILRYVRPRYFFIRVECLHPFLAALDATGIQASQYTEAVVATQNEGTLDAALREQCQERLGVPVYQLPRADIALFLGMECPECRLVHTWSDLYVLEALDPESLEPVNEGEGGLLTITNLFARVCPALRILTHLEGYLVPAGCLRGPQDLRLCL